MAYTQDTQQRATIYRSDQGVIGGVCAGIAQRYDLDAALVRIAALLILAATFGAGGLLYLIAWMALPAQNEASDALDIKAQQLRSEIYEQVVLGAAGRAPTQAQVPMRSVATVPPTPPAGAVSQRQIPPAAAQAPVADAEPVSASAVRAGMAIGIVLIALGAAALYSALTGYARVVQLWPALVVAAGVARIAIPAKDGSRARTTWLGAFIVFGGMVLLASSLGFYALDGFAWLEHAGPFALIAAGLFVMGRAAHSDLLMLAAMIALAAFCVVGALASGGFADFGELEAALPFGLDDLRFLRWGV